MNGQMDVNECVDEYVDGYGSGKLAMSRCGMDGWIRTNERLDRYKMNG